MELGEGSMLEKKPGNSKMPTQEQNVKLLEMESQVQVFAADDKVDLISTASSWVQME